MNFTMKLGALFAELANFMPSLLYYFYAARKDLLSGMNNDIA